MNIINLKEVKNYLDLRNLWNNEYSNIYPISKSLMKRNLENANFDISCVAYEDDKIVGFVIAKTYNDEYNLNSYYDSGWISLIYVTPEYRNQGIGSSLINKIEGEFIKLNKHTVCIGRDLNDFFPGLPIDLKSNKDWFEKRGFNYSYDTCDVINNKNIGKIPLRNNEIKYALGSEFTKREVLSFLENSFPGRWTKEAIDYYQNGGTGREYLLGVKNGNICAFAKICFPDTPEILISNSLTWRERFTALGGIGPLGVNKDYRHQNIGYDIVAEATNILFEHQATDIIIDWTNLLNFYRIFGYEVWKSYYYMTKEMKGN